MGDTDIPGDPGGLATLAAEFDTASGDVDAVQTRVATDGLDATWSGPAATAFRSSLGQLPGELSKISHAFSDAGRAISTFATKLADFQRTARWCAQQIAANQADLRAAQARHTAASDALTTAQRAHSTAADPVTLHATQATLGRVQAQVAQAAADTDELTGKLAGLQAQAAHNHAEYEDAVYACSAGLDDIGQSELGKFLRDYVFDALEGGAISRSVFSRQWIEAYDRAGGWVRGHWRKTPSGGRTWVEGHERAGGHVEGYNRTTALSEQWENVSKGFKWAGVVAGFVLPTLDQLGEDGKRKDLTTTDKVGRAAGAGVYVGGMTWAGAELGAEGGAAAGAAIGSAVPVIGTAIGGVVGGFVGGVIGGGVAATVGEKTKDVFVHLGQGAANDAVHLTHDVGHVLSDINPF